MNQMSLGNESPWKDLSDQIWGSKGVKIRTDTVLKQEKKNKKSYIDRVPLLNELEVIFQKHCNKKIPKQISSMLLYHVLL